MRRVIGGWRRDASWTGGGRLIGTRRKRLISNELHGITEETFIVIPFANIERDEMRIGGRVVLGIWVKCLVDSIALAGYEEGNEISDVA